MNTAVINGTGAAVYLGLGPKAPDWAKVTNLESATNQLSLAWNRNMRSAECIEGFRRSEVIAGGNITCTRLTFGQGIAPYAGGDVIAAPNTAYLVRIGQKELKSQYVLGDDQRAANVAAGYAPIHTWTLDTLANRTGHWNDEASTTYVGEGSQILIREAVTGLQKLAVVTAMTSNGEATDEVTLSLAVKTGRIEFLGSMYDFLLGTAGQTMPAGILISDTTVNVSGDMLLVEWGWFDSPAN